VTADPTQLAFDPYATLGVAPTATATEIHHAYRVLARRFHPDTNAQETRAAVLFAQVSRAYEVLGDADRRRAFDLQRASSGGPRAARVAPGPTGNAAVRGVAAAHTPRQRERAPGPDDPAEDGPPRDEFRFLLLLAKIVAAFVILIVIGALILAIRPGPWCVSPAGPGPNPCGAPVATSSP
jgi:curved DNA-binding protein CbpA